MLTGRRMSQHQATINNCESWQSKLRFNGHDTHKKNSYLYSNPETTTNQPQASATNGQFLLYDNRKPTQPHILSISPKISIYWDCRTINSPSPSSFLVSHFTEYQNFCIMLSVQNGTNVSYETWLAALASSACIGCTSLVPWLFNLTFFEHQKGKFYVA